MRTRQEAVHLQAKKRALTKNLDRSLQNCEKMDFYCLSHPAYGILLWWAKVTKMGTMASPILGDRGPPLSRKHALSQHTAQHPGPAPRLRPSSPLRESSVTAPGFRFSPPSSNYLICVGFVFLNYHLDQSTPLLKNFQWLLTGYESRFNLFKQTSKFSPS